MNLSDLSQSAYAMAAEPIGKPGWPELAFCTMSTARKRSVLMHSTSNAGGAAIVANVAEGAMSGVYLSRVNWVEDRNRNSRLTVAS